MSRGDAAHSHRRRGFGEHGLGTWRPWMEIAARLQGWAATRCWNRTATSGGRFSGRRARLHRGGHTAGREFLRLLAGEGEEEFKAEFASWARRAGGARRCTSRTSVEVVSGRRPGEQPHGSTRSRRGRAPFAARSPVVGKSHEEYGLGSRCWPSTRRRAVCGRSRTGGALGARSCGRGHVRGGARLRGAAVLVRPDQYCVVGGGRGACRTRGRCWGCAGWGRGEGVSVLLLAAFSPGHPKWFVGPQD